MAIRADIALTRMRTMLHTVQRVYVFYLIVFIVVSHGNALGAEWPIKNEILFSGLSSNMNDSLTKLRNRNSSSG